MVPAPLVRAKLKRRASEEPLDIVVQRSQQLQVTVGCLNLKHPVLVQNPHDSAFKVALFHRCYRVLQKSPPGNGPDRLCGGDLARAQALVPGDANLS